MLFQQIIEAPIGFKIKGNTSDIGYKVFEHLMNGIGHGAESPRAPEKEESHGQVFLAWVLLGPTFQNEYHSDIEHSCDDKHGQLQNKVLE